MTTGLRANSLLDIRSRMEITTLPLFFMAFARRVGVGGGGMAIFRAEGATD